MLSSQVPANYIKEWELMYPNCGIKDMVDSLEDYAAADMERPWREIRR